MKKVSNLSRNPLVGTYQLPYASELKSHFDCFTFLPINNKQDIFELNCFLVKKLFSKKNNYEI